MTKREARPLWVTTPRSRTPCLALTPMAPPGLSRGGRRCLAFFRDGKIVDKKDTRRSVSIADAMRHGRLDRIERESTNTFDNGNSHARNTHSAIFAEVRVDEELGVIRVTRVVNAVAAGRILNSKTAHSQIMGGVV